MALAAGLATGAAELVVVGVHRHVLGRLTRVSRDVVWMAPAGDVALFLAAAALLLALSARWPRLRSPRVVLSALLSLAAFALLLYVPGLYAVVLAALAVALGVEAGRHLSAAPFLRAARPTVAVLLALTLALTVLVPVRASRAAAARGEGASAAPAAAPNVLLVILDTVRAASLRLYGYERETSPELERWARRGVLFERAYAPAPWTLPTHGSVFTGRLPHELRTGFLVPLDDRYPVLAEVLTAHGYATAGFTANLVYTTYVHRLDRGFQRYEDYPVSAGQVALSTSIGREIAASDPLRSRIGHQLWNRKSAEAINGAFLDWLDSGEGERPWFAFLNYFDAHEPFEAPPPFDRLFGPDRIREPFDHWTGLQAGNEARRPEGYSPSSAEVEEDREAYDEAVAYVDHALGELLRALERRGALERTLVIIASDHGEQFGEHDLFYHGNSLYTQLIHVPLLMLGAGVPTGVRVSRPVTLRDLPATVMDAAGLASRSPFPGTSLAGLWKDGPAGLREWIVSELEEGPAFSVVRGYHHYILDMSSGRPREELYHLGRDPAERHDLTELAASRGTLSELRGWMVDFLDGVRAGMSPDS